MKLIPSTRFEKPVDHEFLLTPLWGKVIYPASLNILTAPPKAGKSSVLFSWAGALSKGEAWGGIAPIRPLRVLYWDLENPEVIQYNKIEPFRNDNLWTVNQGWVDDDFDISKVPNILQKEGWWPDILIIDPLVYAMNVAKENDATQMSRAMKKYLKFARITKRAVIIAHHDRKPPDGFVDNPRWSGRGSSALPGAVDVQMNILIGRFHRKLQVTMNRFGSTEDHEPSFTIDYNNDTHITTAKRIWE